jgi:hypothetical protein
LGASGICDAPEEACKRTLDRLAAAPTRSGTGRAAAVTYRSPECLGSVAGDWIGMDGGGRIDCVRLRAIGEDADRRGEVQAQAAAA